MRREEEGGETIQVVDLALLRPRRARPLTSRCVEAGCSGVAYLGKPYCQEHVLRMPLVAQIEALACELEEQAVHGVGTLVVAEILAWIYDRACEGRPATLRYLEGRGAQLGMRYDDLWSILVAMASDGLVRITGRKRKERKVELVIRG